MKITKNFGLNMPDEDDFVEIDKINENAEKIDEELAKKADASGGDISETVITTVKASQAEYPVPAAGDSAKTVLGKVQKFFADIRNWMKGVCLLGQIVNNCVTDNAKLPLSAAQGKVLMDLYNVLNTNQKNLINKMESLNSKEITSGTILSTVLGFSQLPGSFAKSGFAAIEDSPLANKSSEFGCIIYGYKDRRIVILTGYGDNASYVRTIYRDRWNSVGWQSI